MVLLPLEQRLVAVGRTLLEAVVAELGDTAPGLQYLAGPSPAVESCDDGDGQLTVSLIRLLPGLVGRPETTPNQRAAGPFPQPAITLMTAEWHIELWRCFPVQDVDTSDVQDAAGVAWIGDYASLKRAVTALVVPASAGVPQRMPGASSAMLVTIEALGPPQGGMRGVRAIVQITTG